MKLQKSFGTLLLGGALAISCQLLDVKPAHADLLAQYTFEKNPNLGNTTSNQTLANSAGYSTTKLGVTQFNNGTGMAGQYSPYTKTGKGSSRAVTFTNLTSNSRTTALAGNTYFTFTLTPNTTSNTRYGAKFDSFVFSTDVGSGSSTFKGSFFVRAIEQGTGGQVFESTIFTQNSTTATRTPSAPTTNSYQTHTINLSGFTNNTENGYFTSPIEFRIYEFDNTGAAGTSPSALGNGGGLRVDNVQVNGVVAPVPELSTGLLVALSLGGLCLVGMRRKKDTAPSFNMAF